MEVQSVVNKLHLAAAIVVDAAARRLCW